MQKFTSFKACIIASCLLSSAVPAEAMASKNTSETIESTSILDTRDRQSKKRSYPRFAVNPSHERNPRQNEIFPKPIFLSPMTNCLGFSVKKRKPFPLDNLPPDGEYGYRRRAGLQGWRSRRIQFPKSVQA